MKLTFAGNLFNVTGPFFAHQQRKFAKKTEIVLLQSIVRKLLQTLGNTASQNLRLFTLKAKNFCQKMTVKFGRLKNNKRRLKNDA